MAVVRQFRGEADDSPWSASGLSNDFFASPHWSGITPPRLWLQLSGGGDGKGWTFPTMASMAFRANVQFRTQPIGINTIFRIRPGNEVTLVQNGSTIRLQRSGADVNISPVLDLTKEIGIELLLTNLSYSFVIWDALTYQPLHTALQGAIAAIGPWTQFQTRFNAASQTFLDNIQINDDASKFIGPEPLVAKQQGQPLYDYGFYYD